MNPTSRNRLALAACAVFAAAGCAVYLLTTGAAFVGT